MAVSGCVPAIIPPLKDEDEAGYKRRCAGEGYVELGGEGGQKHGGHPDVFTNF